PAAGRRRVDWAARAAALPGARARPRNWKPPAPQLATLRQSPPPGDDWLHELKWDGYRLLVEISGGEVRLRSRNGLDWTPDYPEIVQAIEAMRLDVASLDGVPVSHPPLGLLVTGP